jgi:hypothetical protein
MGQQTNRIQKKKRREAYHKRKNEAAKLIPTKVTSTKVAAVAKA